VRDRVKVPFQVGIIDGVDFQNKWNRIFGLN
jgi:hypothetical protein